MKKLYKKSLLDTQLEVQIMEILLKTLVKNEFPPESLNTYWAKNEHAFDLAIIDPKTSELIAIIDLEIPSPIVASSTNLRKSLSEYTKLGKIDKVSFFVANLAKSKIDFHQFIPQSNASKLGTFVPLEKIPSFDSLKEKALGKKRKIVHDKIHLICNVSALVLAIFLLLDFFNAHTISSLQLILIGSVIALLLIPYSNKLKIFNIEFERNDK